MKLKIGDCVRLVYPHKEIMDFLPFENIYLVEVLDIYGTKTNGRYDFSGKVLAYFMGLDNRWRFFLTPNKTKIGRFKNYKSIELINKDDILVEVL